MNTKQIALVLAVLFLLAGKSFALFPQTGIYDSNTPCVNYEEGTIIVKFKQTAADKLEEKTVAVPSLSASLDSLNSKYDIRKIEPVIKGFKAQRQYIANLSQKDESTLTVTEKHLLKRLKRAPKNVEIPDLGRIYKIKLGLNQSEVNAVAEYSKNPDVEYAELNYIVYLCSTPNDPNFPQQWSLHNTGQMYPASGRFRLPPGTTGCDVNATQAWELTTGSSEIITAVIDTGVDFDHRDLQGNMWQDSNGFYGYDFINDDNDPIDDFGHGTHVAGTIAAATNNSADIAGVSWNTRIMAVKFLSSKGNGSNDNGAKSLRYATDNGADILSNSWGGESGSDMLRDAIAYAVSQGVIVVASAGNNGGTSPSYPANYDGVISVAATDSNDDKGSFSNYGSWVDIAAPGVDILSLRGFRTKMGTPYGDKLTVASGTSMACPHVSGACALLLAVNSELNSNDANQILRASADELSDQSICASGRLNVYKAILAAVPEKGYVNLTRPYYSPDDTVEILLADRNLIGSAVQDVNVTTNGGDTETVTLSEAGSDTGIFKGVIYTSADQPNVQNGTLEISNAETITVTYADADDGTGNPAVATDTAIADCAAPTISNISFSQQLIGPEQIVTFTTNEPATSRILCGVNCGNSDITASYLNRRTNHTIKLKGMQPLTSYRFKIEVTDEAGNITIGNNSGNCYEFITDAGPRDINVPPDFNTIQDAINAAWDTSTVWISDGTYTGTGNRDIDFLGRAITVRSVNGPENCIMDCNGTPDNPHRGFNFINEEGFSSIIDGLTIKNAYVSNNNYAPGCAEGGAIQCEVSSPTIRNCVFSNNKSYWEYDDPNIFLESYLYSGGGAICINYGDPTIIDCLFRENDANSNDWHKNIFPTPTGGSIGGSAIRNNFGIILPKNQTSV